MLVNSSKDRKRMSVVSIMIGVFLAAVVVVAGCGRDEPAPAPAQQIQPTSQPAASTAPVADDYPIDFCVVSGDKLNALGDPIVPQHEGREIRFCCDSCIRTFNRDPAKYLAKLDAAVAEQGAEAASDNHDHGDHEH